MDFYIYCYAGISLLSFLFLFLVGYKIWKSKIEKKRFVIFPISIGLISTVSYEFFLMSDYYLTALIFNNIFRICIVWLDFAMLQFAAYFAANMPRRRRTDGVLVVLVFIDSISMIVNIFTHHSYDIVQCFTNNAESYWGMQTKPFYLFHNILCYLMIVSTLIVFVYHAIKAPRYYKNKHIASFVAYFFIILANLLSRSFNLPVDFSIMLYGVLALFISYYTVFTFQNMLVTSVLSIVNDSISDAVIHFDYEGKVVYQNNAAKAFFNSETGIIRESPMEFRKKFLENYRENLDIDIEGIVLHLKVEYQELRMDEVSVGSYIKISDKTEEVNQLSHEKFVANHDELTGLYNRTGFFNEIEKQLAAGKFKHPIMMCSNIKDFKLINDIFGEAIGDEVLRRQGHLMKNFSHEKNINGRLNDDKFAIFMEKEDFKEENFVNAFMLLRQIAENSAYHMAISAGIYEVQNLQENVQVMFDKAKMAMDTISDNYHEMFAWYDSTLMDKLLAEKNIVNEFEAALQENQFEVYIQPVFGSDGKCSGGEILSRWNHPTQGMIYPPEYIDVLEETGLLYRLDMYMCEKTAQLISDWMHQGKEIPFIGLNISHKDRYYIDNLMFFKDIVRRYGVDPEKLLFEVQETAIIDDFEEGHNMFEKIKEEGFKITIDNFGSGYSGLNMLKDYKLDVIKISSDFLKTDELSERSQIILSSMISMAKELGMMVAAQGVETEEQRDMLKRMGCDLFQGFHYSRAIPAKEFEEKYL
ncbi:MAG: EAL domain-containing protein [Treponema sp.]|nr:EAL domain-containing protein [Candidatus Treponema equifaecale]